MKAKPIPTSARLLVKEREQGRCFRCGMRGQEISHRRRRGIRDGQEHSLPNLMFFCRTCHVFLHANPTIAIDKGWQVSSYVNDIAPIPALRWDGAWVALEPDGTYRLLP